MNPPLTALTVLILVAITGLSRADDAISLQEKPTVDYQYHVRAHVDVAGSINVPAEKDKQAKRLDLRGDGVIEYDERVLNVTKDGEVDKTARMFRTAKLQRTAGESKQEATLRDAVKRMVLLRKENKKVPFSPDGALTWEEIDLVRIDVFTPSLSGLLATQPVRVGDKWKASIAAVQALTDMLTIDKGDLECKLDDVRQVENHRVARIAFNGKIAGADQDGPTEHHLDGFLYFDLESNHLSYLSLRGVHILPGKDGKEAGRWEGRLVLSRQVNTRCKELSDDGLKGVALEPTEDNTRLLYDNPDLGVKFLYSRRWRASERANQVTLDQADGNGVLLSVEPLNHVPTGAQFLAEVKQSLDGMKAKIGHTSAPRSVREKPPLEEFNLDAEVNGQKVLLQYFVTKQAGGGVTVAARLVAGDGLADVQREVERIARSLEVTRK